MAVHTGIARYLEYLYIHIGATEEADVSYVTPGKVSASPPPGATQGGRLDSVLSLPPRCVYYLRCMHWLLYERYGAWAAGRHGFDVFHESFYTPARLGGAAAQVFTLHDLSLVKWPQAHSEDRRLFFNRFFDSRFKEADHIIVPSRFVRDELCEYAGSEGGNVTVIHEGVDPRFRRVSPETVEAARKRYGLPSEYGLFVGTLEPRKNLSTLLKGISRAKADLPLVVVGWSGWGDPAFQAELDRLSLRDRVFFPGYVDDADLIALYGGASVFFYPSLYEGFGLPLLEAMACEVPVLCSSAASLPEVAGEAALLVGAMDADAWAEGIDRLVFDSALGRDLVAKGKERIGHFSWDQAARRTLDVFASVL